MPKTITDIIPPSRRRLMAETEMNQGEKRVEGMTNPNPLPPPPIPPVYEREQQNSKKFPWRYAVAAGAVLVLSVGLLFAFGGAKVEVTPVVKSVTIDSSFSATFSAGDLPYEVVTVELTASREIEAEGEETVDLPAQGQVTIYNAQAKTQELIKNTRFESPDGKIFRIRESVSVPSGTESKPGQLQAVVYADAGGTSYNIGPSTFTLPGLEGSASYDLVYAKSEAPMAGGFSGTRPSVASEKRLSEYEAMKGKLESDLKNQVEEKVSDTHALVPGAVFFSYTAEPDGDGASDTVTLVQKATAHAFIFPKEALAKAIAYSTLGVYTGQPVTVREVNGLTFAPVDGVAPAPKAESLQFKIQGETELLWLIDTEEIAGAIAGKTRDASKTILAGFSELEGARIILKPFWEQVMPEDPSRIEVIVKEPGASK